MAKVCIAFALEPNAVALLQTPAVQIAAVARFATTAILICSLTKQMGVYLNKFDSFCTKQLGLCIFLLILLCAAVIPAAISMFISWDYFKIIHGDVKDLSLMNIVYVAVPAAVLFAFCLFLLLLVSCICRKRRNRV